MRANECNVRKHIFVVVSFCSENKNPRSCINHTQTVEWRRLRAFCRAHRMRTCVCRRWSDLWARLRLCNGNEYIYIHTIVLLMYALCMFAFCYAYGGKNCIHWTCCAELKHRAMGIWFWVWLCTREEAFWAGVKLRYYSGCEMFSHVRTWMMRSLRTQNDAFSRGT